MSAVETPPPAAPAPADRRCPRCGTPMTEQQEWCLNCGAAVGTRVAAAPGWRVPLAVAGVLLALAAIAIAVAIIQLADDTGEVAQAPPATATPVPTATPAVPTPSPSPGATATPTATETPQATGSPRGDAEWPAGTTGWTVVLATDGSRSDAESKAADFAGDGIPGVGVLRSDDFSSLDPGSWVVFAGQYESQVEAAEALDDIDARQAYIRRIVPN